MSAQHTTGPWTVFEEAAIDYRPCQIYGAEGGSQVAWLAGGGRKRAIDKPEERANARLIAAAPELLAELHSMVAWCGHRDSTSETDALLPIERQPPEVQAAMRAIAKAVDDQSVVARTCSAERPCINCYADQGECLGPAPETVRARQAQTDEARCVENLQP